MSFWFNKHKVLKSLISGFMVLSIVLVAYAPTHTTPKAQAIGGVGDIVWDPTNWIQENATAIATTLSAGFDEITSWASALLEYKEFSLDAIAWWAINLILQQLSQQIITWINNGFKGTPAFIADFEGFIKGIADKTAGEFISGTELGFLCAPFQLDIRAALNIQYGAGRNFETKCSLSGVVQNVDSFLNGNFLAGGWDGWFAMTSNPRNNPYGALLLAQEELSVRLTTTKGDQVKLLDFSKGFFSKRVCKFKPTDEEVPTDCTTVTPGSAIENQLNSALDIPTGRLIVADEINEILAALFGQLVKRVFQGAGGLLGLTNSSYGSGTYFQELESATTTVGSSTTPPVFTGGGSGGGSGGNSVSTNGGSGTITVTPPPGGWSSSNGGTPVSNASWLTISSINYANNTFTWSATPNTGSAPRTGTITVAGQIFTIVQNGTGNTSGGNGGGGGTNATWPSTMANNPPSTLTTDIQWHQDFRFPDPFGDDAANYTITQTSFGTTFADSQMLAKAELNFNWLMETYGSRYAFAYMVDTNIPYISNEFRAAFDGVGAESARIINTSAGAGNYGPTGYSELLAASSRDGETLTYFIAGGIRKNIILPYPITTGLVMGGGLGTPTPRLGSSAPLRPSAGSGGSAGLASLTPLNIPGTCYGRSVVSRANWDKNTRASGDLTREPQVLDFWTKANTAHIVGFKTDNEVYFGSRVNAHDQRTAIDGGVNFISTAPCDLTTAVKDKSGLPAIGVNGEWTFISAPQSVFNQIQNDVSLASKYKNQGILRLDPNAYYYINYIDDAEVYDMFGPPIPPSGQITASPNYTNPNFNTNPAATDVRGGSLLRFDGLNGIKLNDYSDGSVLQNNVIPGYTFTASAGSSGGGGSSSVVSCNPAVSGGTFSSKPTTNLCSAGSPSGVTGVGPWNWTCTSGNSTAYCSANKSVASGGGGSTGGYCPVFSSSAADSCMTASNFNDIKATCCPNGTITSCTALTGGVQITGTGCN